MVTSLLLTLLACTNTSNTLEGNEAPVKHLEETLQIGDIVLQTGYSFQSWAIREVTDSSVTHVGLVIDSDNDGDLEVIEAVGPVKITSIEDFNARGTASVRRLKNFDMHSANIKQNLADAAMAYLGRPYDLKFKWDDKKIYCSELVWKAYKDIGIEIASQETFSDLNLNGPLAKKLIADRLGPNEKIDPDEAIVSPATIDRSNLLFSVN